MSNFDNSSVLRERIIARAWEDLVFRSELAENPQIAVEREARSLPELNPEVYVDQRTIQIALAPPDSFATEPNDLVILWRKLFA